MIQIKEEQKDFLRGAKFIDLFAGIGGFRYALDSFDCNCVFTSEWDKSCQQNYQENFGDSPNGDITLIQESSIPKHNIIAGGFPCQAFSISGNRKGFQDTRGTLFFDVARIANHHKPEILILENVKNLERHDGGSTLKVIVETLDEIGYNTFHKVLKASDFGIPQARQRIYFVSFRKDLGIDRFQFPNKTNISTSLFDILEEEDKIPKKCYLNRNDITINFEKLNRNSLFEINHNRPYQIGIVNKGGQGERIYHPLGHSVTLSATTGGPGGSTGLYLIDNKYRKLSPRECARLQGFPEHYKIYESISKSYYHFGNSVPINVLQYILLEVNILLKEKKIRIGN